MYISYPGISLADILDLCTQLMGEMGPHDDVMFKYQYAPFACEKQIVLIMIENFVRREFS